MSNIGLEYSVPSIVTKFTLLFSKEFIRCYTCLPCIKFVYY